MATSDFFWKLFKTTGSINAYLIYRHLHPAAPLDRSLVDRCREARSSEADAQDNNADHNSSRASASLKSSRSKKVPEQIRRKRIFD